MFTFAEFRLFFTFVCAVGLLAVAWRIVRPLASAGRSWPIRPLRRGALIGGLLFGAGWALCGACPSIALVQLGEGQLLAIFTVAGILAGNWLCAAFQRRYQQWDDGSCTTI